MLLDGQARQLRNLADQWAAAAFRCGRAVSVVEKSLAKQAEREAKAAFDAFVERCTEK